MTFVIAAALMVVIGFVFCCWPLLRDRRYLLSSGIALLLIGGSSALYPFASNYVPRSAAYLALTEPRGTQPAMTADEARAAADTLQIELTENPEDYASWRLLGRVRLALTDYEAAEAALREAMQRSEFPDPELMVMLGESLSYGDVQRLPNEAIVLFIGAYEMAPNITKAMWYGGLAYAARGDHARAADAWEQLLAQGAPEEISAVLRERVIALRAMANSVADGASVRSLALQVSMLDTLSTKLPPSARLFVSVRNPDSPGPPLAAVQRDPQDLPLALVLSDDDAMLPGRNLSSADRYDIVARISMNGDPLGGAGDLVGRLSVDVSDASESLSVLIDTVSN